MYELEVITNNKLLALNMVMINPLANPRIWTVSHHKHDRDPWGRKTKIAKGIDYSCSDWTNHHHGNLTLVEMENATFDMVMVITEAQILQTPSNKITKKQFVGHYYCRKNRNLMPYMANMLNSPSSHSWFRHQTSSWAQDALQSTLQQSWCWACSVQIYN